MIKINYVKVNGKRVAYKIFGKGRINVVIEMALGSTMGEWWHIAEYLSDKYTVLLYERAGYLSEERQEQRSPLNIAKELKKFIDLLEHEESMIFIAHSQGGLYAQQFCRLYPKMIRGIIFIDPLSANDNNFRFLLTKEEFKKSGVDKSNNLKFMYKLAKLHLGFIIKGIMKSAPPFYYYDKFSNEVKEYILNSETKATFYDTAIKEYNAAHLEKNINSLREKNNFPDIPIVLVAHSSITSINEIMQFGKVNIEIAGKIERIWQKVMKDYLTFSNKSMYVQANRSSHFVHLEEPELIYEIISKL